MTPCPAHFLSSQLRSATWKTSRRELCRNGAKLIWVPVKALATRESCCTTSVLLLRQSATTDTTNRIVRKNSVICLNQAGTSRLFQTPALPSLTIRDFALCTLPLIAGFLSCRFREPLHSSPGSAHRD